MSLVDTESLFLNGEYRDAIPASFGHHSSYIWTHDPKRIGIVLSRYKFVSRMLHGCERVFEIGCGDGFFSQLVAHELGRQVLATDVDHSFISAAKRHADKEQNSKVIYECHDMLSGPIRVAYDAFYSIDVLEHILPADEHDFLRNACASLHRNGIGIIGMPSLESQRYASNPSKVGHVNCKTQEDLRSTMRIHFKNVFMFSMNDEVVHTGFGGMAHYHFAIGCGVERCS